MSLLNFFFYFYCDDFDLESGSFLPMYVNLLPLNLPKLKIPKVAQQFLIVEFMLTTVIHCFIMFCCPYDYLTLRFISLKAYEKHFIQNYLGIKS
ncbi:hypothetical protein RhiirA4_484906 [Rhizophagus irregularis]|uniref:Uncharacterized protein n=1 Tax=Rhizophagus irregularis TaxID=588596 RepID=A0A2I1HPQ4_9GLOM|nr:hypothetical protein RhiirA4_484906 [Rhizophagus irregularis]